MEQIELTKSEKRIFDYMTEFGSITTLQSFVDLGESRLSARIFELKRKGINISSERVSVSNRYGEKRSVSKYWVTGNGN